MDGSIAAIARGIAELRLDAPPAAAGLLASFLDLVRKWNAVYNLTAIQDPARMVIEHVLDSLSIAPLVHPENVVDVGTGAGFPGIPLAIVRPELRITLLDSSHKRCAFLRQAAIELGLANVDIACHRVEQFRPERPYDTAVSRAFAETAVFATAARRLVDDHGIMVAMKGAYPEAELARLPKGIGIREVIALSVPGLKAQRHAVIMTKALQ